MTNDVYWLLELSIPAEKYETFEALMKEMVAATERNEPNTLNYEWTVSDDRTHCHIYERYRDSEAVMAHLETFGARYADRFFSCVNPERMVVYGSVSEQARAALEKAGAEFMLPWAGFAR